MAFEKKWRDRRIVHRTPGGKLTRVKIGSLPADEQQKYNPNRWKKDDGYLGNDEFRDMQLRDIDIGHIFDFYIQVDSVSELDELEDNELILATTDSYIVSDYFDTDKLIVKLKTVPMEAVVEVSCSDKDTPINLDNTDLMEFEDISELDENERYEKIKFNPDKIYRIDIKPFLEYIDIVIDDPDHDDHGLEENFFGYYYRR